MDNLSPAAHIILKYAKEHATENGYVDLQDYASFPEHTVTNACEELREYGFIYDIGYSSDNIEYILLNLK